MGEIKNSFKQLEDQTNQSYQSNLNRIKKSVDSNMNSMAFISNIIDVYFSRVISYVVNVSGGKTQSKDRNNEE